MKAVNKVRLIYLPAIVLPIFVMIVSIAGLSIGYSRINKADLSAGSFERFALLILEYRDTGNFL